MVQLTKEGKGSDPLPSVLLRLFVAAVSVQPFANIECHNICRDSDREYDYIPQLTHLLPSNGFGGCDNAHIIQDSRNEKVCLSEGVGSLRRVAAVDGRVKKH